MGLTLQLKDEKGTVWIEQSTQPTEGQYPAEEWSAGEIVRDQHNLVLPTDLPASRYGLHLSVERPAGGQPVGPTLALASMAIR
jgi:hypothetical protein